MKLKHLSSPFIQAPPEFLEEYLQEMKRLEWIFIAIRWLGVPIMILMAWLHEPSSTDAMIALAGVLGVANVVATVLNIKIKRSNAQRRLGTAMLIVDTVIVWGVLLLFVDEFYTSAYAGFAFVIIEAAIRHGLLGSMVMGFVFVFGLLGAWIFRDWAFGVRFSTSGYAFWTVIMMLIALGIGMVVREGQRQRQRSEEMIRERALEAERQRIADDLHNRVIKTLQGLAMEAHVMGTRKPEDAPPVEKMAHYIKGVCQRTSQEIRDAVFELRAARHERARCSRISETLNDWSSSTGIPAKFNLIGEDVPLPLGTFNTLNNILTEALANVKEHSLASRVSVSIKTLPGEVNMEIRDNGQGFNWNPQEPFAFLSERKLGIATMQERVTRLGGKLDLESDETGTRVSVSLPLQSGPASEADSGDETDKYSDR